MRRKILAAILVTVALALVLSGAGTYLLLRREANRSTEAGLRNQAEGIIDLVPLARVRGTGTIRTQRIVKGLKLKGISIVVVGRRGKVRGQLPKGIKAADIDPTALLAGETVSGRRSGLVFAAASTAESTVAGAATTSANGAVVVAVLTRTPQRPSAPIGWFLVAGGIALAIGAGVAAWLSESLTRPLRQAEEATVRIAAGDLGAHLPEPPPTAHDEVATLTRSINAMAVSLATSRGLERQFLLSISHDLRTPLTSIRGYADAITEGIGPAPIEAARVIVVEAKRLDRLVRDLLDLARLDAREFTFDLRAVAVAEVVVDTTEGIRGTAESAGLDLQVREPATDTTAMIDPDRLAQVMANLGENACKFAASAVWVDVRVEGANVVIDVIDDGPGIAALDLDRVFERLYVTDRRPVRQVGGTGLGLAIVHELVGGMGGRVGVSSPALADGRGARFSVSLPTAPAAG
jgi:two-component system OmpR family sensor kinase